MQSGVRNVYSDLVDWSRIYSPSTVMRAIAEWMESDPEATMKLLKECRSSVQLMAAVEHSHRANKRESQ